MLEDPQTEAQLTWKQAKAQFMDVDKMKLVTRHKLALAITSMSLAVGIPRRLVPAHHYCAVRLGVERLLCRAGATALCKV